MRTVFFEKVFLTDNQAIMRVAWGCYMCPPTPLCKAGYRLFIAFTENAGWRYTINKIGRKTGK